MPTPMQNLAFVRKQHNRFSMPCIVPDMNGEKCGKPPINSHSIQHNGILSLLEKNGEVYVLGEATKDDDAFITDLKKIGITKKASIFKCLCKDHDKQLFQSIEDQEFNKNPEQLFQYALKSVIHSYWSKCNAIHTSHIHEWTAFDEVTKQDKEALEIELTEFWRIRQNKSFDDMLNWTVQIPYTIAIAASASVNVLRKLDGRLWGEVNKDYPYLHLTVFPSNACSYLLISSLKRNESYYKAFTDQFVMLSLNSVLKVFNVLIPLLVENMYISPRLIESMNDREKDALITVFRMETLSLYNTQGISISKWAEQIPYNLFRRIEK